MSSQSALSRHDDKKNLTYTTWKRENTIRYEQQKLKKPLVMATTAGCGGVRIFDIITTRQSLGPPIISTIENMKDQIENHDTDSDSHVDQENEYDANKELLKWRKEQENDDHCRMIGSMWSTHNDDFY